MVSFGQALRFAALVPFASSPALAQIAEQPPAASQSVDEASATEVAKQAGGPPQATQQEQAVPCPAPGTQIEVERESPLAKKGGAAAGGTAAQIAAGAALGPIGAAVAAVVGAAAGKKAGGAIKTKKKVDVAEVRPECAQVAVQTQEARPAGQAPDIIQQQQ